MQVELGELIAVTGGWSGAMVAFATYLHMRRTAAHNDLTKEIRRIEQNASNEHKLLRAQVNDMGLTVAENYVRKPDLNGDLADLRRRIDGVNENISNLGTRVDGLFSRVEWRRNGPSPDRR